MYRVHVIVITITPSLTLLTDQSLTQWTSSHWKEFTSRSEAVY